MKARKFDKRFAPLANVTAANLLGYDERRVHGYLVYYARYARPRTCEQAGEFLGMEPAKVLNLFEALVDHGLAAHVGDGWIAIEPNGVRRSWFGWLKDAGDKPWYSRLAWTIGYVPKEDAPFSDRELVLYFTLAGLADDEGYVWGQSLKGLEALTRISRPTIRAALVHLSVMNWLDHGRQEGDLMIRVFDLPEIGDWLADRLSAASKADVDSRRQRCRDFFAAKKAAPVTTRQAVATEPAGSTSDGFDPDVETRPPTAGEGADDRRRAESLPVVLPRHGPPPIEAAEEDNGEVLPPPEDWTDEDQRRHAAYLRRLTADIAPARSSDWAINEAFFQSLRAM